ncbi:amidohydrolase family protein [Collimonas sp.]|jgi:L-fuconolactonase|uniref:amidohydrolase family protein n=1 Tax=Collimonas sp. TaxID=1963772 RepID=UPI0037BFA158
MVPASPVPLRIDAHQHFWLLTDRSGHWPPAELAAIHRDFLPQQLSPLLRQYGIDGTVLVQSLPSVADTLFLLALTTNTPFIRAVVGWADLKAADAVEQIALLATHQKLRGLRPMLQDLADDWITDPCLAPAIAAMRRHRLSLDALVLPHQLPALLRFAQSHPDLPIVIDHAAKPRIAQMEVTPWREQLSWFAGLPVCRFAASVLQIVRAGH